MNRLIKHTLIGILCLQTLLLAFGLIFKLEKSETSASKSVEVVQGSVIQAPSISKEETALVSTVESEAFEPEQPETPSVKTITYKVKTGDTLTSIWQKQGASAIGGIEAGKAFSKCCRKDSTIKVGDLLELKVDDSSNIIALKKTLGAGKEVRLEYNENGTYKASLIEPNYVERERHVSGVIYNSFFEAARSEQVPFEVIDSMVDVMSSRLEFRRDIHPGDSFSMLFKEKVTADGRYVVGSVLQAVSVTSSGNLLVAVQHVDKAGEAHYYDQNGKPIGNYFLRYPVKFSRISSVFSKSRFHPVLKRHRPHNGVDFAAPTGTPVRAVADGSITLAGYKGGGGKTVKIKHTDRYSTAYLHLSRISSGIRPGARVKRGQVIGKVGMTGLATGPHLHFSFYDRGRYVDPLKVKLPEVPAKYEAIPVEYLQDTLEKLKQAQDKVRYAKAKDSSTAVG